MDPLTQHLSRMRIDNDYYQRLPYNEERDGKLRPPIKDNAMINTLGQHHGEFGITKHYSHVPWVGPGSSRDADRAAEEAANALKARRGYGGRKSRKRRKGLKKSRRLF